MFIEIKVFSTLRQHLLSSKKCLEGDRWDIPEGKSVAEVLDWIGLPKGQDRIVLVNGLHVRDARVMEEGDVLHIFPPLFGG